MTLSELCIRRPVMTTLITASIIAFGVFAFRLLPVSALPRVDFPTIAVTATLPGASADTMAASVAGISRRADRADHRAAPVADRDDDSAKFPQSEPGGFSGAVRRTAIVDAAIVCRQ
jgi:hypothetical protein